MSTASRPRSTAAIVLAAGRGERLNLSGEPKAFARLGAHPMLGLSLLATGACPDVTSIVVVVPEGLEARAEAVCRELGEVAEKIDAVVAGGATRHDSVRRGLAASGSADRVVCHDAARPFASPILFTAVLDALSDEFAGVVPVVPLNDTVKRVRDGVVVRTEDRHDLWRVQTPQAFEASALGEAHERALRDGLEFTDDAACLEWAGFRVRAIDGEPANDKITTLHDLEVARLLLTRADG